jgi:hypothetical protein
LREDGGAEQRDWAELDEQRRAEVVEFAARLGGVGRLAPITVLWCWR